jgi:uncharacterized protein (DUF1330 family)
MAAYWIAHVDVTDEAAYARYAALATDAIAAHGGEFLARAGRHRQLEGRDRARNVVVRFATLEDAVACYESGAYREALSHAVGAAERDLVVVEGL